MTEIESHQLIKDIATVVFDSKYLTDNKIERGINAIEQVEKIKNIFIKYVSKTI